MKKKLLVSGLFLMLGIGVFASPAEASAASVSYSIHGQTYGDQPVKKDGQQAGTKGIAKRLEEIKISVSGDGGIKYKVHGQTYGDQAWKQNGQAAGTRAIAKRLEAIQIELTGNLAKTHDVLYRVHGQTYGDQVWKKNGELAGTKGIAKRLESIEVKLVEKPITTVPVTGVNGSIGSASLTVGDTTKVTASVTPTNATNKTITFNSSNTGVATVDANGNIKAVSAGVATITAQSNNGIKKTFDVTVKAKTQTPTINLKNVAVAWGTAWNNSLLKSGFVSGTDEFGNALSFEKLAVKERQPMNTKQSGNYIYDVSYGGVTTQIWVNVAEPVYNKAVVRAEMLRLVNELRASVGSQALVYDNTLNLASDIRANELVSVFAHYRPNGQDCRTAVSDIDSEYLLNHSGVTENIATSAKEGTDQELANRFFDQWKNSSGHYQNMIDPSHTRLGFSYNTNTTAGYCAQQFFAE